VEIRLVKLIFVPGTHWPDHSIEHINVRVLISPA